MFFAVIIKPKDLIRFLKTVMVLQFLLAFEKPKAFGINFQKQSCSFLRKGDQYVLDTSV